MKRGQLITLEGIEGVGKSSNVTFIAEYLRNTGKQVVTTREPGGTPISEDIRQLILKDYPQQTLPKTELLLLYAGRLEHVKQVIEPALAQGKWVVCDRFFDATFAYQGGGRGIPMAEIEQLHHWTLGDFKPDCTLLLDAPAEVTFTRIKNRQSLDRFEQEDYAFFQRIRQCYLALAEQHPHRFHVIDAIKPLVDVQSEIEIVLQSLLQLSTT